MKIKNLSLSWGPVVVLMPVQNCIRELEVERQALRNFAVVKIRGFLKRGAFSNAGGGLENPVQRHVSLLPRAVKQQTHCNGALDRADAV